MEDYGLNVHPHVATVTYFSDTGAPTIVTPHVSGQTYGEDFTGSADSAFFSFPAAGKHLAFDGRYIHAASGDLKPPDHKGLRRTFLCNVWLNHEPMNSEPMPDEVRTCESRGGKMSTSESNARRLPNATHRSSTTR